LARGKKAHSPSNRRGSREKDEGFFLSYGDFRQAKKTSSAERDFAATERREGEGEAGGGEELDAKF